MHVGLKIWGSDFVSAVGTEIAYVNGEFVVYRSWEFLWLRSDEMLIFLLLFNLSIVECICSLNIVTSIYLF